MMIKSSRYYARILYSVFMFSTISFESLPLFGQSASVGKEKRLIFHDIRTDRNGNLIPWNADKPSDSYHAILEAVWTYWKNIPGHWVRRAPRNATGPNWRAEMLFPPKYLMYRTLDDLGVGGDQFAMMLSSFNLYYDFTGNEEVMKNMLFQADWYIKFGLSAPSDVWPDLPYPCNTTEAPVYDGDLLLGKGFMQPDKAGSFGSELVMLYKKTSNRKYLDAAVKIANTLSKHTKEGDYDHSPLPFKVHAITGEIKTSYCTNWVGTMQLFTDLIDLQQGNVQQYQKAYTIINEWMLQFPVKNNRWGPFFEDINAWSDTEITEGTFAWYMLTHKDQYPNWKSDVRNMQDWAITKLGLSHWKQYGLTVMGEQSVYKMQGQSHTSRHASIELLYSVLTGDTSKLQEGIRQLNFSTYAVDYDGKCRWMNFNTYEIWWTDGYGDFIRHFLRSMYALPELAPSAENHILNTTSVLQKVSYAEKKEITRNNTMIVEYKSFDTKGEEILRLTQKPKRILLNNIVIPELKNGDKSGFSWKPLGLGKGGVLTVNRRDGNHVRIFN